VVRLDGTISAEHGVGKLKRELLATMYGEAGIRGMLDVKRCFDPGLLLGRGTMFGG
jgi:FAD/FMN-containing dehydrogenase